MTEEVDKLVAKLNQQKGEIIGINAMFLAITRRMPPGALAQLLRDFDSELEHAKSNLSYQPIPDEVISGLDLYGQMLKRFLSGKPRS